MGYEAELPRGPEAPGLARRSLEHWFGGALDAEELDDAKLCASELVSNAVLHGTGRIELRAQADDDRILLEVLDQGSGFEHVAREVPFDSLRGRGLSIVEAASSRWGVHEGTTHVWAEIERKGPRLGQHKKPN